MEKTMCYEESCKEKEIIKKINKSYEKEKNHQKKNQKNH